MRSAKQWLDEYAKSHQSAVNQRIHQLCVPLIYWSITALLYSAGLVWFGLGASAALIFYFILGVQYFIAMAAVTLLTLLLNAGITRLDWPLVWIALAVFVAAWMGQFYGHKVEGKKPSFLKDLLFLLVGPLWVLKELGLFQPRAKS